MHFLISGAIILAAAIGIFWLALAGYGFWRHGKNVPTGRRRGRVTEDSGIDAGADGGAGH